MRKLLFLTTLFLLFCFPAKGQGSQIVTVASDPPTCNTGQLYFNSTTNTLKTCGPNNTWTIAGGSLTSPSFISGSDFLISDSVHGQIITDGSWGNSSSTLNSAGMAQWTPALIGDVVFATNGCRTGTSPAGLDLEGVIVPLGTVLTVPSATQMTVSTTSTAAQASAGCIVIGQRQDTGMANLTTAVNAFTQTCPTVNLPSGIFLVSAVPGFLTTQPTSCTNAGLVQGLEPGGLGGFYVRGQGGNSTTIAILPDLLPTACVNGVGSKACFVIPTNATWSGFRITGSGNAMNGRADNTKQAVQVALYSSFDHMVFDQWGTGDTGFAGVVDNGQGGISWNTESLIDSFGNLGLSMVGNGSTFLRNITIQNVCGSYIVSPSASAAVMISEGGVIVQTPSPLCSTSPNRSAISVTNGAVWRSGPGDLTQIGNGGANSNAIFIDATSFAYLNDGAFINSLNGAGQSALQNLGTVWSGGAKVFFHASGSSSPSAILNSGASANFHESTVIRLGSGVVTNSGGAKWWGSGSATGAILTTGNVGLTSGWGASTVASVANFSDAHSGRFTITGAVGSASPVITLTFPANPAGPTPYLVAPASCVLFETGANDVASLTNPIPGTPGTSSVTFTFTGTPAAVTYVFDYACSR